MCIVDLDSAIACNRDASMAHGKRFFFFFTSKRDIIDLVQTRKYVSRQHIIDFDGNIVKRSFAAFGSS